MSSWWFMTKSIYCEQASLLLTSEEYLFYKKLVLYINDFISLISLCISVFWFNLLTAAVKPVLLQLYSPKCSTISLIRKLEYLEIESNAKSPWKSFKRKLEIIVNCDYGGKYRGAAHSICNLKFNVLNEIPAVFRNG